MACRFVPASFAWFTPPMYAPGLGFLMFAVGVNLKVEAFKEVFKKPQVSTSCRCKSHWQFLECCTDEIQLSRKLIAVQCSIPVHCGWSCGAVAGQTIAGAHSCANTGTNAWSPQCSWHRLNPGAASHPLSIALMDYWSCLHEQIDCCRQGVVTLWRWLMKLCCAGVLCLWSTAVKLCNILGAPRASSAQHCSDCAVNCGRGANDSCTCTAAAGGPYSCRPSGHGTVHHTDCPGARLSRWDLPPIACSEYF